MEADRDALEQEFQKFQDRQRKLESTFRDINDLIPNLDTKMQKIGLEVESSARNLVDAQRRIRELSKEHQPSQADDNRIASLGKEVLKLNKEIEKLRGETASVEQELRALQDKIMEVGGEKLRTQKSIVDDLKGEIDSLNEAFINC